MWVWRKLKLTRKGDLSVVSVRAFVFVDFFTYSAKRYPEWANIVTLHPKHPKWTKICNLHPKARRAYQGRQDPTRRRQWERRLKSEFAFFQSLSRLFLPTYFVKCRRTLLKLNSSGPHLSSEREIKFRRCLFAFCIKRENSHFHVLVVQKRQKNVQERVTHVQSCSFAYKPSCFFFLTFS